MKTIAIGSAIGLAVLMLIAGNVQQYNITRAQEAGAVVTFHSLAFGTDGWSPNGSSGVFNVTGTDLTDINSTSTLILHVNGGSTDIGHALTESDCHVFQRYTSGFAFACGASGSPFTPTNGTRLDVTVINHG